MYIKVFLHAQIDCASVLIHQSLLCSALDKMVANHIESNIVPALRTNQVTDTGSCAHSAVDLRIFLLGYNTFYKLISYRVTCGGLFNRSLEHVHQHLHRCVSCDALMWHGGDRYVRVTQRSESQQHNCHTLEVTVQKKLSPSVVRESGKQDAEWRAT
jgi:hypothetical protein